MIKVSVVIPVYNMETYIEECLDSIFSQTLKEIEVLCIDDGSTDRSYEILKKYMLIRCIGRSVDRMPWRLDGLVSVWFDCFGQYVDH